MTAGSIDAVEVRVVRLPLVRPFATAHGRTTSRDVLLVRVLGPDGEGWGECAADTVPTYWHETVATVWADLTASGSAPPAGPMARAALEMAMLDLRLRGEGTSLAKHLGATRASVDATVTAGFDDDADELAGAGYRSVKVKVDPGHTTVPAALAGREGLAVQVDANGSFDPERDRAVLDELDGAGLALIEQPFAADRLDAHAELARAARTPIGLDESIATVADAGAAISASAGLVTCVKPSRLGGLGHAVRVHERCARAGAPAKVGGMLETGIGRAAAVALAALPGFTMPADLAASDRYWADDIVAEPFTLDGEGRLEVPTGPGLGVDVRIDAVDAATVERMLVRLR